MDFGSTQWTRLLALRGAGSSERGDLLGALVDRYWPPIYAWLRRKGHPAADAEDLTQAFFAHLLEKGTFESVGGRERGSFRGFILACLRNFVASDRRTRQAARRHPGRRLLSIDSIEASLAHEASPREADQEFQYQWARRVIDLALAAMGEELSGAGRQDAFRMFETHLRHRLTTGTALSRRDLAERYGKTEKQVDNLLHPLRKDFRRQLEAVVRDSVGDASAFDEEIRHLRDHADPG